MKEFQQSQKYASLIVKHLQQSLTAGEKAELDQWIASSDANKLLFEELTDEKTLRNELSILENKSAEQAWKRIVEALEPPVIPVKNSYRKWWIAAASIFLFTVALTYFFYSKPVRTDQSPVVTDAGVIKPGGDKATLELSDGTIILLDSAANGNLAKQASAEVIKLDGRLSYTGKGDAANTVVYNTIRTPRGGKYQLVLSDGTTVWLNAASSLTFPVVFSGNERKVEVTGEAYFEVARNPSLPFRVTIPGKGQVEVFGTHFNINAYTDEEAVRTTLLEGSIGFSTTDGRSVRLMPGQQAKLDKSIALMNNVDTDEVIAWKTGWFNFDHIDISSIMRQVSRWYDVDVVFEGKACTKTFSGIVSRDNRISEVLSIMEKAGVVFRMEGKRITVLCSGK